MGAEWEKGPCGLVRVVVGLLVVTPLADPTSNQKLGEFELEHMGSDPEPDFGCKGGDKGGSGGGRVDRRPIKGFEQHNLEQGPVLPVDREESLTYQGEGCEGCETCLTPKALLHFCRLKGA